ncbi:thiamine phosphate synthase [Brevundimonas aveniformis]|uniref:thiamine phosphate synthase n=1 Tax=Brevundimonas aveniformis TaxID=370977 RepID=UPI00249345CF|nr:thiamine phosphate synthase [Brevundimonas aveniformis]
MPPLLFLTDPERTPEPWVQAARLPPGAGVVFRAFGRADQRAVGARLAEVCRAHGLIFLVGADEELAGDLGADGLHLPERNLGQAVAVRARRPGWRLTGSAHSPAALAAAGQAGLDAALLSPVFASHSPSAGAPLGVDRFRAWTQRAGLPVYALGGVTRETAPELADSRACGLAAVGGI